MSFEWRGGSGKIEAVGSGVSWRFISLVVEETDSDRGILGHRGRGFNFGN